MISLAYYKNSITDSYVSENEEETCTIIMDDKERNLVELLGAFIKICQFAGYNEGSFDSIIERFNSENAEGHCTFKEWVDEEVFHIHYPNEDW